MSNYSPKNSSLFLYVPVVILGLVLVGLVFKWQFKGGEEVGASLPPPVHEVAAEKVVNHRALAQDAGLAADGKMLYTINCASCHGNTGEGDGPRAAGLNPPPRKYKTEKFKFGTDVVSIHNTISQGSPGTSMPSFALLPEKDIWAMVHYVRTMIPNPTPTDDAILAKLPEAPAGGATDAGTTTAAANPNDKRIPITLAMQQVAEAGLPAGQRTRAYDENTPGAQIFLNKCAACHGKFGEGKASAVIAVNPYRYEETPPLYAYGAPWLTDRALFDDIVIHGRPGRVHPGCGTLTRAQLDELYHFVLTFAQ